MSLGIQEIKDFIPVYYDNEDSVFVEDFDFTIVNETEFVLNPGETQTITLRYSPEDVGSVDAFLFLVSSSIISLITLPDAIVSITISYISSLSLIN